MTVCGEPSCTCARGGGNNYGKQVVTRDHAHTKIKLL